MAGAWEQIATYEEKLQGILLKYLNSNERITVYGEPSASKELRVPVISFTVKGTKSQVVVEEVERRSQFGFRNGHMYSHRLVKEVLRLEDVDDGVVRVSMLHYNTGEYLPVMGHIVLCFVGRSPADDGSSRGGNKGACQGPGRSDSA